MPRTFSSPHIITHIKTIENLVKKYGDVHLKEIDLTHSQAAVIIFLDQERSRIIQQRDIEQALNLTNPTVSVLLTRLEEKGFITRMANPADNRSWMVQLTDKADAILDSIYESMSRTEQLLFEGLSQDEIHIISSLMKRIATNAVKHL